MKIHWTSYQKITYSLITGEIKVKFAIWHRISKLTKALILPMDRMRIPNVRHRCLLHLRCITNHEIPWFNPIPTETTNSKHDLVTEKINWIRTRKDKSVLLNSIKWISMKNYLWKHLHFLVKLTKIIKRMVRTVKIKAVNLYLLYRFKLWAQSSVAALFQFLTQWRHLV